MLYGVNGWASPNDPVAILFRTVNSITSFSRVYFCVIMVCFNLVLIKKMERSLLFGSYSLSYSLSISLSSFARSLTVCVCACECIYKCLCLRATTHQRHIRTERERDIAKNSVNHITNALISAQQEWIFGMGMKWVMYAQYTVILLSLCCCWCWPLVVLFLLLLFVYICLFHWILLVYSIGD